ncbi:E3 ubiquitin-protein ligase MARCHF3 [Halotydeus destructor]|nr:E3 ubiquitin-protein ligase MARCHF3 [Halotydeus destructor]
MTKNELNESTKSTDSNFLCRICQDKNPVSGLIAPCHCCGSINHVHRKCLNFWLTESRRTSCELCGKVFVCERKAPTVLHWLKQWPRPVLTDSLLCALLTPLALLSVVLCYKGAASQVEWSHALESICLFALGSFCWPSMGLGFA